MALLRIYEYYRSSYLWYLFFELYLYEAFIDTLLYKRRSVLLNWNFKLTWLWWPVSSLAHFDVFMKTILCRVKWKYIFISLVVFLFMYQAQLLYWFYRNLRYVDLNAPHSTTLVALLSPPLFHLYLSLVDVVIGLYRDILYIMFKA